jgi:hypothetical protein
VLTADGRLRRSPGCARHPKRDRGRPTLGRRDVRLATCVGSAWGRTAITGVSRTAITGVSSANGLIAGFRLKRPDGLFTDKRHYVKLEAAYCLVAELLGYSYQVAHRHAEVAAQPWSRYST